MKNHPRRTLWLGGLFMVVVACVWLVAGELRSSRAQSVVIADLAAELTYRVAAGPSDSLRFPTAGPLDVRRGYTLLPSLAARAVAADFTITQQARWSPRLLEVVDRGLFPIYREKTTAGLKLLDRHGQPLYSAAVPRRTYGSFAAVPARLVDILLFIENRELLDPQYPYRNPAIEWDRLARSALELGIQQLDPEQRVTGGSTLATQMEKYRHSSDGVTGSVQEKFRQVASASLRAYLGGRETLPARQQIVVDYLDSLPLGAAPGHGEVFGLGDGLAVWYGADFARANALLAQPDTATANLAERTLTIVQAVSLLLAQRRPSYYLQEDPAALERRTAEYLAPLARAGVISEAERDAAFGARLKTLRTSRRPPAGTFVERKAANALRPRVQNLLGVPTLYDLDRLDLTIGSTLDAGVQAAATRHLQLLADPLEAERAGLRRPRLLVRGDPAGVIYSLTLYERTETGNVLRVQTDSFDQPLNVNEGVKLELGSSAKLRTLVSYLEIIAELHDLYSSLPPDELVAARAETSDRLAQWVRERLQAAPGETLPITLDAAMLRLYRADPAERFFTGGGLHRFNNFDPEDNPRVLTVREALRRSVNLVFVRMMRDIVQHEVAGLAVLPNLLIDADDPRRVDYLQRFADQESRTFLTRYHRKYRGRDGAQALELLLENVPPTPVRLTAAYAAVAPGHDQQDLAQFLATRVAGALLSDATVAKLHTAYVAANLGLADLAYHARIHPLELWTVAYLREHPESTLEELDRTSAEVREEAYGWLFRTRRKHRQDERIRTLLEIEAFQAIHQRWKRLGYPFGSLVPSLATAIGSSADRPAALAELAGIIQNDGVRLPIHRVQSLAFAEGTPFETRLDRRPSNPSRVLRSEIATQLKRELVGVVTDGTAVRLRGAFHDQAGREIAIGGKTGTGDNRRRLFDTHGQVVGEEPLNRTSVFVFLAGDRHFGTITAYVPGAASAGYEFTSSLPVAVLALLAPELSSLFEAGSQEPPGTAAALPDTGMSAGHDTTSATPDSSAR